jgi:hypothetical protein
MGKCWTPIYTVQTSKIGLGPPRVQTKPLEWDPDPPLRTGSGSSTMGSQGSRTEHTRALIGTQMGVRCRHVSRPDLVITYTPTPRSGGDSMLPRGISQRAETSMMTLGYARLRIHYR